MTEKITLPAPAPFRPVKLVVVPRPTPGRLKTTDTTGLVSLGKQRYSVWQAPISPNHTFPPAIEPNASSAVFDCGSGCLFNVTADSSEYFDLAAARPADVARLTAQYHALNKTMYLPVQMLQDPRACSSTAAKLGDFLGPYYHFASSETGY